MPAPDPERDHWLRRIDATGSAQARYLWLLLVLGLFFAALAVRGSTDQNITVPVVDLELNASLVLAAGAPVLAFLVLAAMGAIRAWTHALEQFRGAKPGTDAEQLDTSPNALDLAMYTTEDSPRPVRILLSFVYPTYLSAVLVESAWLWAWVWRTSDVAGRSAFLISGAVAWLPATLLVLAMWLKRIKQIPEHPRRGV